MKARMNIRIPIIIVLLITGIITAGKKIIVDSDIL